MSTHYRSCNICEAMCGIKIKTRGTRILSIEQDKDDPLSRGYVCTKAKAIKDLHEDPDRLRQPVKRTGSGWQKIGWDQALDETARGIRKVQKKHGRHSAAVYIGNPAAHFHGLLLYGLMFTKILKTRSRFSASSLDQLPLMLTTHQMFGHQLMFRIPDIDRTDYFVIMGGNPVVSNGSIMTAADMPGRLRGIRARGGKVVVIDPIRTKTAALADEHHFIRPGTDALLMLALLHTVFEENLAAPGKFAGFCDNMAQLKTAVKDFTPEAVAPHTGITAAATRRLARDFVKAGSAVFYGRMGSCAQDFGTVTTWLILAFNIVTGKMDQKGGFMFPAPAYDLVAMTAMMREKGAFNRYQSRVSGYPEFGGEFPMAALSEEILTPGKGRIRSLFTIAGNPVISAPNGRKLDKALSELDFMAAVDWYVNETTRHCHIILPPTGFLEHDHFDLVFQALSVRHNAKYSRPVFEPGPGARHNWQILLELSKRMEKNPVVKRALSLATPERILQFGIRFGPRGAGLNPLGQGLTLDRIAKNAHGLDLGPMEPCLPDRLFTKNKRINLAPVIFATDLKRVRDRFFKKSAKKSERDLLLIGRRHIRTNNSWLHNSPRMVKGKNRCTLLINPKDANKRKIKTGDLARVSSRVGHVDLEAEISDHIMPGAVSIPHGWGHHRPGVLLKVATAHPGVSANDITDQNQTDELCGNAALNGVPVKVEKAQVTS